MDTLKSRRYLISRIFTSAFCQRPYHAEYTGSRLITAVKQRWARLVLGWVTAWEHRVLLAFFFCLSLLVSFLYFGFTPLSFLFFLNNIGKLTIKTWNEFQFAKIRCNNNNNNYYYYYLLQLGCYPVAVVIFRVNKTWNWLILNLSREGYMRSM